MTKPLIETIRKNVSVLMQEQRLNSVSLSKRAGISQRAAYRISRDTDENESATVATLEAVAKALGVQPYQLLIDANDDGDKFGLDRRITKLVMKLSPAARAQVLQLAELLAAAQ